MGAIIDVVIDDVVIDDVVDDDNSSSKSCMGTVSTTLLSRYMVYRLSSIMGGQGMLVEDFIRGRLFLT
jgi:hypothetical protein